MPELLLAERKLNIPGYSISLFLDALKLSSLRVMLLQS